MIKFMLTALLLCASAWSATTTTVSDTIYNLDGTAWSGRIVLTLVDNTYSSVATYASLRTTITVTNGVVSVVLVPNSSLTPAGTLYKAEYYPSSGTRSTEYWQVGDTTPTTIRAIRTTTTASVSGVVAPGQIGLTTLGDIIYAGAAAAITRLAGNTTTTRKFLRQTGTGTASAAPVWDTLVDGDIPKTLTGMGITFTGTMDASGATTSTPYPAFVSDPVGCSVGQVYRNTATGKFRKCYSAGLWGDEIVANSSGNVDIGTTVLDPIKGINRAPAPLLFRPVYDVNPVLSAARTPVPTALLKDPAVAVGSGNIYVWYTFGVDVSGALDTAYAKSSGNTAFDFAHQGVAITHGDDGSYDECGAFSPSQPLLVGGTYYLYYTAVTDRVGNNCAGGLGAQVNSPWSIALATAPSLDGSWTKAGSLVVNGATDVHTLDPWMIPATQSPDGLFRLYVIQQLGGSGRSVVLFRASAITGPWTKYGIVYDPSVAGWSGTASDCCENPAVSKVGNWWYLTVDDATTVRSHVAVSSDGLSFTPLDAEILTEWNYGNPSPSLWDQAGSDALSPFTVSGKLYAAYQGSLGNGTTWGIGIAELGRNLARSPARPALGSSSYDPTFGAVTLSALATPSAPAVSATCSGTCATTYSYTVSCSLPNGGRTSAPVANSASNAETLDATNYNTVTVGALTGAAYCDVWRTAGGATQGKIAYLSGAGGVVVDTALVGDGTAAPTTNTTGRIAAVYAALSGPSTATTNQQGVYLWDFSNSSYDLQFKFAAPNTKGIYNTYYNNTSMRWFWGQDYSSNDFFWERHIGTSTNKGKPLNIESGTGHLKIGDSTPALTGCGTSPSITGTDSRGSITTGPDATACTITFASAYATAGNTCVVSARSGTQPPYTVSTAALTLTTAAGGAVYDFVCFQ